MPGSRTLRLLVRKAQHVSRVQVLVFVLVWAIGAFLWFSPSAMSAPAPANKTPDTAAGQRKDADVVGDVRFGSLMSLDKVQALYMPAESGAFNRFSSLHYDAAHKLLVSPSNDQQRQFPPVAHLPVTQKKRILVTGGAGFVGSHLVDRLMLMGHEVTVIDNFFTGDRRNVQHWFGHPHFELIRHDVVDPFMMVVDVIYHLACPSSPPHYQYKPIKTVKTSVMGTINMLGLAKRVHARFLLTSTSGTCLISFFFHHVIHFRGIWGS